MVWKSTPKHDYLSLPNWKDGEMQKSALRQVRHQIKSRKIRVKDSYGVFMAKLTDPCNTHHAIKHPPSSVENLYS